MEVSGGLMLLSAFLRQRRRWDYTIAFCSLLTLASLILKPTAAILPAVITGFAMYQYRKCSQLARIIGEAEELQRWVERLEAEQLKHKRAEEERPARGGRQPPAEAKEEPREGDEHIAGEAGAQREGGAGA